MDSSTFYNILVRSHSGLRWIVLILLVLATLNALKKWRGGDTYTSGDKKINLFTLIFTHIQLLLGFILLGISPKVEFSGAAMGDAIRRFFSVEHTTMMLLAVVFITMAYRRAKNTASDDTARFKGSFILYLIALLLILIAIPWPFRELGAGWF